MNTLARICWISSPVYLLVGMGFGIWMSATQDHTLAPAHAHLNLIGGVLMAIFGGFYTLFPGSAQTMLARIQVGITHLAVWFMFPGIIMAITGKGETLAKIGSVLGILAIVLFLVQAARADHPFGITVTTRWPTFPQLPSGAAAGVLLLSAIRK
jgi:hypothetical protein